MIMMILTIISNRYRKMYGRTMLGPPVLHGTKSRLYLIENDDEDDDNNIDDVDDNNNDNNNINDDNEKKMPMEL